MTAQIHQPGRTLQEVCSVHRAISRIENAARKAAKIPVAQEEFATGL
jgi:hypothetical protein